MLNDYYTDGIGINELSRKYNYDRKSIAAIITFKTYRHVSADFRNNLKILRVNCTNKVINENIAFRILCAYKFEGMIVRDISKKFGISRQSVTDIIYNRTWKTVPRPFYITIDGVSRFIKTGDVIIVNGKGYKFTGDLPDYSQNSTYIDGDLLIKVSV